MITRRSACGCILGALSFPVSQAFAAQTECPLSTAEVQANTTPAEALERLKSGNERFVAGKSINCDLLRQVRETSHKQTPFAAIVGCIDSRVPPEIVFDQRIGDVFCARIAGNFVNVDILGSLEYSTEVSGAKAIVVLGHTRCGAITSAMKGVKAGNITALLENFKPALESVKLAGSTDNTSHADLVHTITENNVKLTVADITRRSPIIKKLVDENKLIIAGAIHDVDTGLIRWLT